MTHPVDQLEPGALESTTLLPTDFVEDPALRIQMSIAISMKRIADALTGGEGMLNAYFFEQAAYQAGLAFERGRR